MKLRCAVLDDYQDVALAMADWSGVRDAVDVVSLRRHITDRDELVAALEDYEIVVLMRERTPFPKELIETLPKLKLLITTGMVNRGIDVAGDIVAQILPHQTHEVVACVADMIFGLVLVPLHTHVAVDRVQALCHRAAALDVRFLDAHNLEVTAPVPGLVSGAAPTHAATDDEDIRIYKHGLSAAHYTNPCLS